MRATVDSGSAISPHEVTLTENSFWSVYGRPDEIEIECNEGMVWITQEGDHRDIILHSGQRYRNETRGLTVVQALAGAKIIVNGRQGG